MIIGTSRYSKKRKENSNKNKTIDRTNLLPSGIDPFDSRRSKFIGVDTGGFVRERLLFIDDVDGDD